jgi:hypothetical protein
MFIIIEGGIDVEFFEILNFEKNSSNGNNSDKINEKTIYIHRESVCMGDDCLAPNEGTIKIGVEQTIRNLLDLVETEYRLAQISGGKATWVLRCDKKMIAVVSQEWGKGKLLIDSNIKIENIIDFSIPKPILYYNYLEQIDPNKTYMILMEYLKNHAESPVSIHGYVQNEIEKIMI